MCTKPCVGANARQSGFTLVELIVFIVIVSSALAGVLTVLNNTTQFSADPMVRKQMLAIAEGVMEEVRLQPFTWCDPDDANAATATSAASCTGGALGANDPLKLPLGPTAGESLTSATTPFDNVADYNGASITTNAAGTAATVGSAYTTTVVVAQQALGPALAQAPASASLLITVTVSNAGGNSVQLQGYRTRYAPTNLP